MTDITLLSGLFAAAVSLQIGLSASVIDLSLYVNAGAKWRL